MPPEPGGIPGRDHSWEVPYALMVSPGGCANYCSFAVSGGRAGLADRKHDNPLVRILLIIVMVRWTGLAPWKFQFCSLTFTFLKSELRFGKAFVDTLYEIDIIRRIQSVSYAYVLITVRSQYLVDAPDSPLADMLGENP